VPVETNKSRFLFEIIHKNEKLNFKDDFIHSPVVVEENLLKTDFPFPCHLPHSSLNQMLPV